MKRHLFSVLLVLFALVTLPVQAADVPVRPAKDFPHDLAITYVYHGLPIPMRLNWQVQDDRYSLKLGANLFGRTRAFTSDGRLTKNGLAPEHFTDVRDGKLQNEATFDWANHQITLHDGDKTSTETLDKGTQDLFSTAFQFAIGGVRNQNFSFSMVSGRKIYPNVAFEVQGEKNWRVGGQVVKVILLRGTFEDRVFDFWLAPQWSNLPVRMIFNLGNDAPLDLWATEITIDGKSVLDAPAPTDSPGKD
ncbi:DUF3108 domain-containing protein [Silvimonas iriomotensis]|uniref:DUF3108 domain-containing protein n=1 Tax=Silvimonas iriomotensis TaxID=449662 RepID=A0ABQ2PDL2_9NEIS|nr:DUF3108 domain-containing protein [Silvimonas iriomotensis]GGP23492.1 hypothetical protein GCM10010970_34920 [Silvimonas iriomotensis]